MNGCEKLTDSVPYLAFESVQAQNERHIKRLWVALLIAIVAVFASNCAWLWYINQYDFESYSYEYEQDGRGLNIIGDGNGVRYNGTADEGYEKNTDKEKP
jgi:hypothetical protein